MRTAVTGSRQNSAPSQAKTTYTQRDDNPTSGINNASSADAAAGVATANDTQAKLDPKPRDKLHKEIAEALDWQQKNKGLLRHYKDVPQNIRKKISQHVEKTMTAKAEFLTMRLKRLRMAFPMQPQASAPGGSGAPGKAASSTPAAAGVADANQDLATKIKALEQAINDFARQYPSTPNLALLPQVVRQKLSQLMQEEAKAELVLLNLQLIGLTMQNLALKTLQSTLEKPETAGASVSGVTGSNGAPAAVAAQLDPGATEDLKKKIKNETIWQTKNKALLTHVNEIPPDTLQKISALAQKAKQVKGAFRAVQQALDVGIKQQNLNKPNLLPLPPQEQAALWELTKQSISLESQFLKVQLKRLKMQRAAMQALASTPRGPQSSGASAAAPDAPNSKKPPTEAQKRKWAKQKAKQKQKKLDAAAAKREATAPPSATQPPTGSSSPANTATTVVPEKADENMTAPQEMRPAQMSTQWQVPYDVWLPDMLDRDDPSLEGVPSLPYLMKNLTFPNTAQTPTDGTASM